MHHVKIIYILFRFYRRVTCNDIRMESACQIIWTESNTHIVMHTMTDNDTEKD